MIFELVSQLLKSIYDPLTDLPDDDKNYEEMLLSEEIPCISPQLYILLKEQNLIDQTPKFFQDYIKESHTQTLYKNLFIKHQTDKIFQELDRVKVEVIPLKGVFFSERYFGELGARPTSDIDLLVNGSSVHNAIESMEELGFILEEQPLTGHFHCTLSKELPGSLVPLCVEIHWDIIKEDTSNLEIAELWEEAILLDGYQHVYELSFYHTFYLMCLHAWRHNLDSMKCYMDLTQLLIVSGHQIDYMRLKSDAKRHKTWTRIVRTLSILYQDFPFMKKVAYFPFERPIRYSFSTKEKGAMKYVNFLDYHLFSYDTPKHRWIGLYTGLKEHLPIHKVR